METVQAGSSLGVPLRRRPVPQSGVVERRIPLVARNFTDFHRAVGRLIGAKGSNVHRLRDRSGCLIDVYVSDADRRNVSRGGAAGTGAGTGAGTAPASAVPKHDKSYVSVVGPATQVRLVLELAGTLCRRLDV